MKIWMLIGFVALILLANTILNRQIIKENQCIYNKKNAINLVLRHLVDLNYLTIIIDDLQDNVTKENEPIKAKIVSLKKQEFTLIAENHSLLVENNLIDNAIKRSIAVLENNEIVFENFISK